MKKDLCAMCNYKTIDTDDELCHECLELVKDQELMKRIQDRKNNPITIKSYK